MTYRLTISADRGDIMSVSLKKSERANLSKPSATRKLPEYTPVHLIDEDETIKNRPARSTAPNKRDIQPKVRSCTPVHIRDEQETINPRSVSELRQYENERRKQKKWYVLAWFGAVALVILVCVAVFVLVTNLPLKPVETPTEDITADMAAVEYFFSVVTSFLGYLLGSPIFILLLSLSALGLAVNCIKQIMNR